MSQWPPKEYSYDLVAMALVDHEYTETGHAGTSERLAEDRGKRVKKACPARDDPSAISQPSSGPHNTAVASGVKRGAPTPQPFPAQRVQLK